MMKRVVCCLMCVLGTSPTITRAEPPKSFLSVDELGPVVSREGHLYYGKTGDRARMLGLSMFLSYRNPLDKHRSTQDSTALILARYGINLLRFHYHAFSYAYQGQDTALRFNPGWIDDIDRIVAAGRNYGIYFGLSGLFKLFPGDGDAFPQPFFPGDDLRVWKENVQTGKYCARFDPRYLALYKKVLGNFLNHVNPYTKRAYKDDPAFMYFEIWNEDSLGYDLAVMNSCPDSPYNQKYLMLLWRQYLTEKYGGTEAAIKAWGLPKGTPLRIGFRSWRNSPEMQDVILFGEWVDLRTYREMKHLLDTQCRRDVPVMLTQLQTYPRMLFTQTRTNLGGLHAYYSFDYGLGKARGVPLLVDEVLSFGSNGYEGETDRSHWGLNDNRLVSIPTMGAAMALQDLDGVIFFNAHWDEFEELVHNASPQASTRRAWGGRCYNISRDPVHRSLLKVADHLYRRGDLSALEKRLVIRQTPQRLLKLDNVARSGDSAFPPDWVYYNLKNVGKKTFEYRIGNEFSSQCTGITQIGSGPGASGFEADLRSSGTLPGNFPKGWQFHVDTLRTQGFWGWNRTPGRPLVVSTSDFRFETVEDVCAVVATSEDMVPLCGTKSILLVTVGKAHNIGQKRPDGEWNFETECTKKIKLFWPDIRVSVKRPTRHWTLQPLDDAFEPLGRIREGTGEEIRLNDPVHFYRLRIVGN